MNTFWWEDDFNLRIPSTSSNVGDNIAFGIWTMLIRPLWLISLTLLCFGCARAPMLKEALPVVGKTQQIRASASFNHAVVQGRVNVSLHTGYARPQVILRGDPRDIAHVTTIVKNNTLLISVPSDYPKFGGIKAEIRGHFLNSFTYRGVGEVTGPRIHSGLLDLDITNPGRTMLGGNIYLRKLKVTGPGLTEISGIKGQNLQLILIGNPRVKLSGLVNVSSINLAGNGWLALYWVKSDTLTIRARGKTFMQLGGITNKLDLELWDSAHFNGRYLRARSTFAKTHQRAMAEITSLGKQHTLATDASNIYFYNIPDMKADFMAYNGSVLDMRDMGWPALEEYTRYNK